MTPLDIITAKVSSEGFPVPRELLIKAVERRFAQGRDLLFVFGPVVFTVTKDKTPPRVHMYSKGAGTGLLSATAKFHSELWKHVHTDVVVAPISNESVAKLALRFGWEPGERNRLGYTLYFLRR
jgi:hypothetical protein